MSITAAQIMDRSAAFLNDAAKTIFTYAIQTPYLNAAIDELQEGMQLNSVPAINKTTPVIVVASGVETRILLSGLPTDFISPQGLLERTAQSTDPFSTMTKQEFLIFDKIISNKLGVWSWQNQSIQFIGALVDREVKVNYIGTGITPIVASTDTITLLNCASFLAFRTAGLCAILIGENKAKADELNQYAELAMERFIRMNGKGTGPIIMPRKPYFGAFKPKEEQ